MKINFKTITCFLLTGLILFSALVASRKNHIPTGKGEIEFWSAPATEKILQDRTNIYDDIKESAQINVLSARGEYESGQIIMTATGAVSEYDITLTDLSGSGSNKFSKENIQVYNEKYIKVNTVYDTQAKGAPTGMYPDALLPFENAKKYGENKIKDGENQGIYVTFKVAHNQPADIYRGNMTITYDGKVKDIPITLEVADIEVSRENNSKSIFLNEWYFDKGELDSTQEMFNAYTEKLLEYRLSPDYIVVDTKHSAEDIEYFVDLAYEYMQNPNCTNLTMPVQFVMEDSLRIFDTTLFKNYLRAILRKSFETDYNMMHKMIAYINDEPHVTGRVDDAVRCTVLFKECLDTVASESWLISETSPVKDETIASMLGMENIMTTEYSATFAEIPYKDTTISPTFCPTADKYDKQSERALYTNQSERWWYTCVSPKVPYPTYHTEDTLLSARTMGWMQAEYDVVGNLFWATTVYAKYDGSKYISIEDSYENAVRFPNVNGDGYLFYPGAPYGIFGPIGSLRLEAIRDGLEEYELIVAMLDDYRAIKAATSLNFDEKKVVESLTASLYDGTKVHAESKAFDQSRKALISLAQLANSKANLCITDYFDDNNGTITYKVYVNDGYELKNNGALVTESQNVTGGKLYTVRNLLNSAVNKMELSVEIDGKEYSFTQQLGGAVITTNAADEVLTGYKSFQGSTNTFSLVNTDTIISGGEGKLIKMVIGAAKGGSYQAAIVSGKMTEGINSQNNKVILYVYYESDDKPKFDIMGKFKGTSSPVGLKSIELQAGINEIEIVISGLNWDRYDSLEELRIFIGTMAGEPERTLYIIKSVAYGK